MRRGTINSKIFLLMLFALAGIFISANAQLKIGNNPTSINSDALLELQTTNKGFLLPRVALTATTSPSPLGAFVQGMLVYDTVTVGDITPGMYYCDGTKWIKLTAAASSGNAWNITGNSNTDPVANFIGTTDGKPLLIKTNAIEQLRVTEDGKVGIGTTNPGATLHIKGDVIIGTLVTGNTATDSVLLVDPQTGLIKKASLSSVGVKVLKSQETVLSRGQALFNTPASFTDAAKLSMYRNGVLISFTTRGNSLLVSEVPCDIGDEIKIIQLL